MDLLHSNRSQPRDDLPTKLSWKETIPFIPPMEEAKVIKVYDGDTITVACHLPFENGMSPIYRFNVRLSGINCPEMRTKNKEEKEAAKYVQQILENMLLGKYVTLENITLEKYGRLLADVLFKDVNSSVELNINYWLLNKNYAVKYDGKKKKVPVHWKKYIETGKGRLK